MRNFTEPTPDASIDASVRQIFAEYGVPSDALIGREASGEYLVLLSGEQLPFLNAVLPKLKRAADAGRVPEDSYIYLQQVIRRRKIEEKFSGPPENPKLQAEIEQLAKTDQAVRQAGQKKWDLKKMKATDRADEITAKAILAKYGLPTFALVGPDAASGFADVIQHQPLALEKQVLPQMKAKAAEGQIDSEHYAMLLDRVQSHSHQPQTYGENFVCTSDGKFKPSPIADAQQVDHRRAELGLMPLAVYGKLLGKLYMGNLCAQVAAANVKTPNKSAKPDH